jgi:hypothetical protein
MKRLVALAVFSCAACGELNNDDLVFLNGTPTIEELRIDVERANPNALAAAAAEDTGGIGDAAVYYSLLADGSEETNGQVEAILDFIDGIGRGAEPTTRTSTSRVWGPYPSFERSRFTLRYEINRVDDGFRYCLHVGRDSEVDGEPTCDDVPSGHGMTAIIYGSYRPQLAGGGVRNSDGEVTLNFEGSFRLGFGDPSDRGVLAITHAYGDSGAQKTITIDAATPADDGTTESLQYAYARDAAGRISYNLAGDFDAVDTSAALEHMVIGSCWHDDGPGLANIALSEGDLASISPATIVECWNVARDRTYVSVVFPQAAILNGAAGDQALCPPANCP